MSVAGVAMIVLGAGAALMPLEKGIPAALVGALLLAAGLIEVAAGSLRRDTRIPAMLAGGVTVLAGLLFLYDQQSRFFPIVNIVIGSLALRSAILAVMSRPVAGPVRTRTSI